jgi:hypothetical protein
MEGRDFSRMLLSGARTAHDEISDLATLWGGCLFTYEAVKQTNDDVLSLGISNI